MNERERIDPEAPVDLYDMTYGHFEDQLYRDIRGEIWGEDFGQNSWITAAEQDEFLGWLGIKPGERVLDVACGSGGPTLRIAERTGARVLGVDVHADGIKVARERAAAQGMGEMAAFEVVDADQPLGFESGSFDVIVCIDAINHLADRPRVLSEWARVLRPGGRLLYTDPAVVTEALTNGEIAQRSSIGFFLFVAPETNDRMLADAGLMLIKKMDVTEALARTARRWVDARARRAGELKRIEGDETFEGQQRFLDVAARIAMERRLSRYAYLARKPG